MDRNIDVKRLPKCRGCGSRLVDQEHFREERGWDSWRSGRLCQKCQDWVAALPSSRNKRKNQKKRGKR